MLTLQPSSSENLLAVITMMMMTASSNNDNNDNNNDISLLSAIPAANEDDYLPNSMTAMIQGVDSEDVEESLKSAANNSTNASSSLFQQLLHHLDPSTCLTPALEHLSVMTYKSCLADKREEFEWRLPTMLQEIRLGGKPRTPALQKFYRLVDREHKENRLAAIASNKDTVKVLASCLKISGKGNQSRTALLILNNLCIPLENKVAIMFSADNDDHHPGNNNSHGTNNDDGSDFSILLTALLRLIQARNHNSYLCLVTLVNLSATPDATAKRRLFQFIPPPPTLSGDASAAAAPPPETYRVVHNNIKSALDEPTSCIRTIESILRDTIPYRHAKGSVEQQCCRWAMNVVRNLVAANAENGLAVAKSTVIPELAVTCLLVHNHVTTTTTTTKHNHNITNNKGLDEPAHTVATTTHDYATWTRDSLPDAAIMVLVHLAKDDDCLDQLRRNQYLANQILQACDYLMATAPGIHATRAAAMKEQFHEMMDHFATDDPNHQSVGYSV
jgi:hypothetical protein